jgi:hypothetical protein
MQKNLVDVVELKLFQAKLNMNPLEALQLRMAAMSNE